MSNHLSTLARQGRQGEKWEARVTPLQERAILRAAGSKHGLTTEDLFGYVGTGDSAYCTDDVYAKLGAIRKAAQADLTDSQAKRIWPRKVAAVLLYSLPR